MKALLVIAGAGPAGVAAALWARAEFQVIVLERALEPGGQLRAIHVPPPQLPGVIERDGAVLADACRQQLETAGVEVRYGAPAGSLEAARRPIVRVGASERIAADAVMVATGLRRRRLGVPGEREFEGRGVSTSATRDREELAGSDVVVVGGGDAAFENALMLAEAECRVTLAMRGEPRAREQFVRRAEASPLIRLSPGTRVIAFVGDEILRTVRLEGPGGEREIAASGAVVKIGAIPNSEWCAGVLATDQGYVRVDTRGRTSLRGVWAAGDITRPRLLAISVAEAGAALAVNDAMRVARGGSAA